MALIYHESCSPHKTERVNPEQKKDKPCSETELKVNFIFRALIYAIKQILHYFGFLSSNQPDGSSHLSNSDLISVKRKSNQLIEEAVNKNMSQNKAFVEKIKELPETDDRDPDPVLAANISALKLAYSKATFTIEGTNKSVTVPYKSTLANLRKVVAEELKMSAPPRIDINKKHYSDDATLVSIRAELGQEKSIPVISLI